MINPLQHPQTLFVGFDADDPRLLRMQHLVGTFRVQDECLMHELRPGDWDLLVVESQPIGWRVPPHLQVLAFATPDYGHSADADWLMLHTGRQHSRTLRLGEELTEDVRKLLTSEALPWLEAQEKIPYLQEQSRWGAAPTPRDLPWDEKVSCQGFVTDADSNVVVGAFRRDLNSWCWAIPYRSTTPELWLAAALQEWRKTDATRFPDVSPWRAREPWITSDEITVMSELEALESERKRALSEFATREQALIAAVQDAHLVAEHGPRRLLTAQSDELVDAVKVAFERLGFDVTDVDEVRTANGMVRVEDLHLTDPDNPDLRILAEVKGYTGGAKARDLIQISQHVVRYVQREGVAPDRTWYVVNQFLNKDPDLRQPPLVGATEDVDAFADEGGLVIDTRELFRLAEMTSAGRVTQIEARSQLVSQRGIFAATSTQDEPAETPGDSQPSP